MWIDRIKMASSCVSTLAYRCRLCDRDALGSMQRDLRRMNEHLKRAHGATGLTREEFDQLESCQSNKIRPNGSYHIAEKGLPSIIEDDFRSESSLEMKLGFLKSDIILFQGEKDKIGRECFKYFYHHETVRNPFFDDVLAFLETGKRLCNEAGSSLCRQLCMRNSEGHCSHKSFSPVQPRTIRKYASTVADLVFFATKCPWEHGTFDLSNVVSILSSILFEPHCTIQQTFMTRKFIQMSYVTFGCGEKSRNAQKVVHQCIGILYAMRILFMHHCLKIVQSSMVTEPERISAKYFNSTVPSSFTALQNIKRPAKGCIDQHYRQNVTWTSPDYTSLEVHTGRMKLERVAVSHNIIKTLYDNIVSAIMSQLRKMKIEILTYKEFRSLRESGSSTQAGEGMLTFNDMSSHTCLYVHGKSREFRLQFMKDAAYVYKLSLAVIHLCGGPSPRGTEEAVTRILNSHSERIRNIQLMTHTIGIQNGYKKQRNYVDCDSSRSVVVKYLPIPFSVILANVVLRIKPVEAEFALMECNADKLTCNSFLLTDQGIPVDPLKMASLLSESMNEFGLDVSLADFRHALEAFSHKFRHYGAGKEWNPIYALMANHTPGTSAIYGRDQNSFVGVPADICEDNCYACNMWNLVVLDSPSDMNKSTELKVYQQLNSLGLLSPGENYELHHTLLPCVAVPEVSSSETECRAYADTKPFSTGDISPSVTTEILHSTSHHNTFHHETPVSAFISSALSNGEIAKMSQPTQALKHGRTPEEISERRRKAEKRMKMIEELRPMQKEALQFLECSESSALVVMATGTGKTQLMWSYKNDGQCTVILAPYRILVEQLTAICQKKGITVAWPLETFTGSTEALLSTVQFAVLPYEAAPHAHTFISALHTRNRLGPIWIDEVHTLCSKGRFREAFDDFWNLGANLTLKGVPHKFIGLTATLRDEDVSDVMRRMSVSNVALFKNSCYREGLDWEFNIVSSNDQAMNHAMALAAIAAIDKKVLIITTSKQMSEDIGLKLQNEFSGWDGMMCYVTLYSVKVLIHMPGTSCAGTGLDIFGVAHIIVVGLPFSIEQLLQWAGRCRSDGNITVIVPSSHFYKQEDGDLARIVRSGVSDQDKYKRLVSILDGFGMQKRVIIAQQKGFDCLRNRLLNIGRGLKQVSRLSSSVCLVCSSIAKQKVQHAGGCPSLFNICFKCMGQHRGQDCTGNFFKVAAKFCFKCWMPLFDIFGVSFHSKNKEDLRQCNNSALFFIKPLAMLFFYRRDIVDVPCSCGDIRQYQQWLFSQSQDSVSGDGQIPNVLLLLEALLSQMRPIFNE